MPSEPTDQSRPLPDDAWEIDGAAMYRAVSFAIALPAFMVGTALFMLGFSLTNSTVLHIACVLYSLAFAGFTSRIIVGQTALASHSALYRMHCGCRAVLLPGVARRILADRLTQ